MKTTLKERREIEEILKSKFYLDAWADYDNIHVSLVQECIERNIDISIYCCRLKVGGKWYPIYKAVAFNGRETVSCIESSDYNEAVVLCACEVLGYWEPIERPSVDKTDVEYVLPEPSNITSVVRDLDKGQNDYA